MKSMNDMIAERSEGVLRVQLNRPEKRNAMTSSMYTTLADVFIDAAGDERIRAVLWHGAGEAFCAGNDLEDFLKNPPAPGDSPQARLMHALVYFEKPLIAAVHGAAIGGGTTMLLHCDFNLATVPEFGSTFLVPLTIGHIRAADLMLSGSPFNAGRAAELGLVTRVVPDQDLLPAAIETARKLAAKPAGALQSTKRLLKRSFRDQIIAAMTAENETFSVRINSEEAKEALTAFLEKRAPNFARTSKPVAAA
jgi:enoyl-CoA hydratase/carnithine racemase